MAESTESTRHGSSPNESTHAVRRARIACKACNARRVKCDAVIQQPCWHCRIRQTPCELIESRRGKYFHARYARKRRCRDQHIPCSADQTAPDAPKPSAKLSRPGQILQNPHKHHLPDSLYLIYTIEILYKPREGSTEPLKVHYPIPASIAAQTASSPGLCIAEPVSLREALTMPACHIAHLLIRAFFELVHPAFPVIDRENFTRLYPQGQVSPLVLQAIFLVGFTVCSESLIREAGYSDRAIARKTHYLRAKMLYDADYEKDPLSVVAALLLFGFWWSGPEDQKDYSYWVGCATILALSFGIHRSSSQSGMSQSARSLRKRIWWSIYVRDRHTAAAFGRPCRIRDEDCDIEPLTGDDFQFDSDYDQALIPAQESFHISYAIEMSKLAIILGDILIGEFSPRRPATQNLDPEALADRLTQWECQLPTNLRRLPLDASLGAPFWANMLYTSYHNCHVLLFRPETIGGLSPAEAEMDVRARMAADSITRIAEDILAAGTIKYAQVLLVPALFGALSVHTLTLCCKDPIRQKLAENKSRQCLLALCELSGSWPVKIWFAKAFANLMRRLTGVEIGSVVNVPSSTAEDFDGVAFSEESASLTRSFSPGPVTSGNSTASDILPRFEPSFRSPLAEFLVSGYTSLPADQLLYDPFPFGHIDNTFGPNMTLYNSLGPTLPNIEDSTEEASPQGM
ncbi:hypothetical protein BDW75DRAFT_249973 [Aspergillus navahoensis]